MNTDHMKIYTDQSSGKTNKFPQNPGPIGIFDSGYGGLTILDEIQKIMPEHDFIYLGDNARTPYGTRSFEIVYKYTLECVRKLFDMGCHLVILACNTASAKALRTIQQNDLPMLDPNRRVLGVIRPTVEAVEHNTKTLEVGLLATPGTVQSESYPLEIHKINPSIKVHSQACPMWVPLIENNEHLNSGSDYFIGKYITELMEKSDSIDSIILGCTHYPLIEDKIRAYLSNKINVLSQGRIVSQSLAEYLERHPEIKSKCTMEGITRYYTTESPGKFNSQAGIFLNREINAEHLEL